RSVPDDDACNSSDFFDGYGTLYGTVRQLLPQEALELIKKGAVLVDVRDEAEMNGKYFQIPGLIYLERRHLEDRFERLPKDKPLILADSVGMKGKEAVVFLQQKGYTQLANINGGIFAWEDEKLPMVVKEEEILAGECACRLRPRKAYRSKSGTGC
ncbi:MAG TPA: rhodanese-like domain-containing protein, partial [Candidatus Ozemobacteraceae bacterium]|nr:rhodanese-like domain-containing protein [Candidatus Ozemobacteraceae bacterium]